MLDIRETADFADYFVLCTGTSDRMLNALADGVMDGVRERFRQKGRLEGQPQDGWVLIDYGDIIVHLFAPDRRQYYRLEELWSSARVVLRLQ